MARQVYIALLVLGSHWMVGCTAAVSRPDPQVKMHADRWRTAYAAGQDEKPRRALVVQAIDGGLIREGISCREIEQLFGQKLLICRLQEPEHPAIVARGYMWFDWRKQETALKAALAYGMTIPANGWHIEFALIPMKGGLSVYYYLLSDNPEVWAGAESTAPEQAQDLDSSPTQLRDRDKQKEREQ